MAAFQRKENRNIVSQIFLELNAPQFSSTDICGPASRPALAYSEQGTLQILRQYSALVESERSSNLWQPGYTTPSLIRAALASIKF